ncbi:MAG: M20/M25/M40 family metallo-hydrolase [Dehalococcoidia bacterium]
MKRYLTSAAVFITLISAVTATSALGQQTDPDVAAVVADVEQARLFAHIEEMAEPRSALEDEIDQLDATADYVQSQLEGYGLEVVLQDVEFEDDELGAIVSPNVIGVKAGSECADRIFVVGGHYDSVPESPGADDDASGTAGMLEIARVLADVDLPASVYFTGFTLEELGLIGSRKMAGDFAAADAEVVGMFSLEMIGYTDEASGSEFILVLGNEASAPLLEAVEQAKSYVPDLPIVTLAAAGNGESSPDTRRSDHAPFWDAGYQALLVTDTANFRNPNYHEPSDTIETLDMPFATSVTKAMLATTMLYLTRDEDGDGAADVCTAPLLATATPAPAATPIPAAPTVVPAATQASGVTLPETGTGDDTREIALLAAAVVLGVLAVAVIVIPRRGT